MYSVVQSINQCITFLVHCSPGFACHKTVWRPPKCVYILDLHPVNFIGFSWSAIGERHTQVLARLWSCSTGRQDGSLTVLFNTLRSRISFEVVIVIRFVSFYSQISSLSYLFFIIIFSVILSMLDFWDIVHIQGCTFSATGMVWSYNKSGVVKCNVYGN